MLIILQMPAEKKTDGIINITDKYNSKSYLLANISETLPMNEDAVRY